MEWQGGNKQRPNYWQWRLSSILGDSNWKSSQVGYPVNMYSSPNWMLSRVRSVKHFFGNALSRAHRGVLVPTSLWLGPIDSLPFATGVFWLHLKTKTKFKEKYGKKTPLSTFHCNQLQHTRSACFKTDLPDHFRFNFVKVVTEPCGSVVLLWRHGGHVTEMRDFEMQTTQMLEVSCLFSFKSILLCTSGKCQSIKRTACVLNFIYIVQSKWYLRLKISVQGPFKSLLSSYKTTLKQQLNVEKQWKMRWAAK